MSIVLGGDSSRKGLRERIDEIDNIVADLAKSMGSLSAMKIENILKSGVDQKNPDIMKLLEILYKSAPRTSHSIGRTYHNGKTEFQSKFFSLFQ